jgi:hypothetical protein
VPRPVKIAPKNAEELMTENNENLTNENPNEDDPKIYEEMGQIMDNEYNMDWALKQLDEGNNMNQLCTPQTEDPVNGTGQDSNALQASPNNYGSNRSSSNTMMNVAGFNSEGVSIHGDNENQVDMS